jgi:ABC-type transport system involved in multi-copper enzyme maturation permease subunit
MLAFLESVRDRILYGLLVFAFAMIASATVLTSLAVGGEGKIVKDLGLSAISLAGLCIALFLGVGMVSREIERRTIYPVMSRPVRRAEFVVGKFLGLGLTLSVNVAAMAAGVLAVAWALEGRWSPELLPAILLAFLELLLVTALAIFFSTFTTPTLSAVFTLSLFVIGHLLDDVQRFAALLGGPAIRGAARALAITLPDLSRFRIGDVVVNGLPLQPGYLPLALLYGAAYLVLVLAAASLIFARRDLK